MISYDVVSPYSDDYTLPLKIFNLVNVVLEDSLPKCYNLQWLYWLILSYFKNSLQYL